MVTKGVCTVDLCSSLGLSPGKVILLSLLARYLNFLLPVFKQGYKCVPVNCKWIFGIT